jgi:hypothetical protein
LKNLFILIFILLVFAGSSTGQQADPLSPLLAGETIANAIVLTGPLPITSTGTTAGYLDDYDEACPYTGSTSPDVVYAYTPSSNLTVDIDLCGSSYDTKVFVYENAATPGVPFACNDDYYFDAPCGAYVSKIEGTDLAAGNTYYIVIDGYSGEDYGNYVLTVSESANPAPCVWGTDIVCPPGASQENETCGANSNGGCDMAAGTETWETVPSSGGTICGTTWANGGSRDTDWFQLTLTGTSDVVLTANADRQIFYGLVQTTTPGAPTCASRTGNIIPGNNAGPCSETSLDLGILNPGTYWVLVEMTVTAGFPCNNHYWIDFDVVPVSCPQPESLSASNITQTTAFLGWTETGSATAWEYQYGPAGFTPSATGTPATINPKPITGLIANSSYDFYVRADCGGGIYSDWSGPENFITQNDPAFCAEPANLAASSITQTGANLAWTPVGSETAWEYAYGISPFPAPAGSGTATSSNTLNPLSGLVAGTEYQYYVRANCGSGFSTWAGPGSFTTSCNAITSFPYHEGFESAWSPGCWTDPEKADYGWDQSVFGNAHSGSQWAYCNLAKSQLTTPAFFLPSGSRLVFWYRVEDPAYPQDMDVKIGDNAIYQITGATNDNYQQVQVSLDGYTGQTVSVSFVGETGTGGVDYGICLDDVSIRLTNSWTGNFSTNWNNTGNWSGGAVPDQSEVVIIPTSPSGGIFPVINSGITAQCYKITLSSGATLKVKSGGTLIVLNP